MEVRHLLPPHLLHLRPLQWHRYINFPDITFNCESKIELATTDTVALLQTELATVSITFVVQEYELYVAGIETFTGIV